MMEERGSDGGNGREEEGGGERQGREKREGGESEGVEGVREKGEEGGGMRERRRGVRERRGSEREKREGGEKGGERGREGERLSRVFTECIKTFSTLSRDAKSRSRSNPSILIILLPSIITDNNQLAHSSFPCSHVFG